MADRSNHTRQVVLWLAAGILLVLQGVLALDWIVVLLVSLPLMLLAPARDDAGQWSLSRRVTAFVITLVLFGAIGSLVLLAGGSVEMLGRVILVVVGSTLVVMGLTLLVRAPA